MRICVASLRGRRPTCLRQWQRDCGSCCFKLTLLYRQYGEITANMNNYFTVALRNLNAPMKTISDIRRLDDSTVKYHSKLLTEFGKFIVQSNRDIVVREQAGIYSFISVALIYACKVTSLASCTHAIS